MEYFPNIGTFCLLVTWYSFTGEKKAKEFVNMSLEILYTSVFKGKVKIYIVILCCDFFCGFPNNSRECTLKITLSFSHSSFLKKSRSPVELMFLILSFT